MPGAKVCAGRKTRCERSRQPLSTQWHHRWNNPQYLACLARDELILKQLEAHTQVRKWKSIETTPARNIGGETRQPHANSQASQEIAQWHLATCGDQMPRENARSKPRQPCEIDCGFSPKTWRACLKPGAARPHPSEQRPKEEYKMESDRLQPESDRPSGVARLHNMRTGCKPKCQ